MAEKEKDTNSLTKNFSKIKLNETDNSNKKESAIKIQACWRGYIVRKELKKTKNKINIVFNSCKNKLFKKEPDYYKPTPYEYAAGMTYNKTKNFQNYFGKYLENVLNTSNKYNKFEQNGENGENGGNDGMLNNNIFIELKSKYNTMKASLIDKEITPKMSHAINKNKKFYLFIINDIKNESRNIPLHKGVGCSKIQKIKGYDENKHRWISDDKIFELLFNDMGIFVKNYILKLLKDEKIKRESR
jgi:hypothetical protein